MPWGMWQRERHAHGRWHLTATLMAHDMLALYLGWVVGVAGLRKVLHADEFRRTLVGLRLVPARLLVAASVALVTLELLVAGGLWIGAHAPLVALVATAMFFGFVVVKSFLLLTRRAATCGCLGTESEVTLAAVGAVSIQYGLAATYLLLLLQADGPLLGRWVVLRGTVYVAAVGWVFAVALRRHMADRAAAQHVMPGNGLSAIEVPTRDGE